MQRKWLSETKQYTKRNNLRRAWRRIVRVLACIVVFCTVYALILPAITMEKSCELEEHTHSESCYTKVTSQSVTALTCSYESLGVHSHVYDCYSEDAVLLCAQADYVVHEHTELCLDEDGALVCQLPRVAEHSHSETCYQMATEETEQTHTHTDECYTIQLGELICTTEETEGHTHSGECYTQGQLLCQQEETQGHTHSKECYMQGEPLCQQEESEGHTHSKECYMQDEPLCQQEESEEHTHSEECYLQGEPLCQQEETEGHTHSEECYMQDELLCQQEESEGYTHNSDCYEKVLNCEQEEFEGHAHSDECYEQEQILTCSAAETVPETTEEEAEPELICTETEIQLHTHGDDCYEVYTDEEGTEQTRLICTQTVVLEHTHSDACFTVTEVPLDDIDTLTCGLVETEGHAHAEECYDENGQIICTEQETAHAHSALCYGTWERICGKDEHVHDETCQPEAAEEVSIYSCGLLEHAHTAECYDAEGSLICEQTEHSHGDSGCELTVSDSVAYVIGLIEGIPSADEIDAKIAEFEAAGDTAGEEAWLAEVYQQVAYAYFEYSLLCEEEKAQVTNADKLLALEYIWSATTYNTNFWEAPTVVQGEHTSDFIDLNLYDYGSNINDKYFNETYTYGGYSGVKLWPGFQWNGGAYVIGANSNAEAATYDRHRVDFIDFGNSLITDFEYGTKSYSFANSKSSNSISVGRLYNSTSTTNSPYKTGIINRLWRNGTDNTTMTNRPIGMSMNSSTTDTTYDVLKPILTSSGYPVILSSDEVSGFSGVLDYLFSDNTYATKKNTESIDGLFQMDSTGAYYFNSRLNHAQYSNNKFTLYKEIITPNFIVYPFGNFLPFNSITNSSTSTDIGLVTDGNLKNYLGQTITKLTDTGDATKEQLKTMLGKYRTSLIETPDSDGDGTAWNDWSALDAIQDYFWGDGGTNDDTPSEHTEQISERISKGMYNIDFDVETNFFFGMDMSMRFYQPKNGKTGYDTNNDGTPDYDMKFYFTGDDDVWVYIDGNLFLDMTGIHRHVGGEIDFVNGVVNYYELDVEGTGDVKTTPYQTFTFKDLVTKAIKFRNRNTSGYTDAQLTAAVNEIINPETGTFYDYSTHTFKFFYTERGSGSSVCRMNFNFPILKKNSLTITKENVPKEYDADGNLIETNTTLLGNPDYYFNVIKKDESGLFITPGTQYKILDSAGTQVGTGEVDQYGIITLKAGQSAVFEGIAENAGSYYVQELIKNDDHELYAGQVMINGKSPMSAATVNWSARSWYTGEYDSETKIGPYGYAWLFYSSYYADASSNSAFYFEAQNGVITDRLAQLSITKKLDAYEPTRSVTYYKLQVELDGQPLPAGLTYTVTAADGTTRTETVITETDDAGNTKTFVQIAAGETATITNILSGTRFTVTEDPDSAAGYNVFYSQTGAESVTTGTSISGIARVNGKVAATVTNAENGTQLPVDISGTKSFSMAADADHSYTFVLEQVALDVETGAVTTVTDGVKLEKTVDFTGDAASFSFDTLTYLAREFDAFPANRYYLIYETGETATALDNTQQFLVQVTITQDTTSTATEKPISAAITGVWEGYVQDGQYIKVIQLNSDTSNGLPVNFVNTLKDSLIVSKTVDGSASAKQEDFAFTLTLEAGGSNVEPAGRTFRYEKITAEGTETGSFRYDGTSYSFALKHGEILEVLDLPVGTIWTVTETARAGYLVSWQRTAGGTVTTGETENARSDDNGIVLNGNRVDFTNEATYVLPETGGAGTTSYTMAGLMLMLIGAAYLVYNKKRRREAR